LRAEVTSQRAYCHANRAAKWQPSKSAYNGRRQIEPASSGPAVFCLTPEQVWVAFDQVVNGRLNGSFVEILLSASVASDATRAGSAVSSVLPSRNFAAVSSPRSAY
jgi:hypothetical protein